MAEEEDRFGAYFSRKPRQRVPEPSDEAQAESKPADDSSEEPSVPVNVVEEDLDETENGVIVSEESATETLDSDSVAEPELGDEESTAEEVVEESPPVDVEEIGPDPDEVPAVETYTPVTPPVISSPPLMERAEASPGPGTATKVRIIGCGQCGSQVAATFVGWKPDYVPTAREEFYPLRAVAFDTHEAIANILSEQWRWEEPDSIYVLPMPSTQYLTAKVMGDKDIASERQIGSALMSQQAAGGVGGVPYLGRLAAESTLLGEGSDIGSQHFDLRNVIRDSLQAKDFVSGILVTCNSLTGGTGTGFSPIAARFLREKVGFNTSLTLNVSVLPGEAEVKESNYPRNILASLHYMLTTQLEEAGIVDSVIVVDNDELARNYGGGRSNYRIFNEAIRDMLVPFLLAPQGKYTVPELGSNLDENDIRRWIKSANGFGLPEVSAIGFASKPLKDFMPGRFSSRKSRAGKVDEALRILADEALLKFSLGADAGKQPGVGGVGLLFGPPEFFETALDMDSNRTHALTSYVREAVGNDHFRTFDCLAFDTDGLDEVGICVLVGGASSQRLTRICEQALGRRGFIKMWDMGASLTENIRNLPTEVVEDLMISEIRQALGRA